MTPTSPTTALTDQAMPRWCARPGQIQGLSGAVSLRQRPFLQDLGDVFVDLSTVEPATWRDRRTEAETARGRVILTEVGKTAWLILDDRAGWRFGIELGEQSSVQRRGANHPLDRLSGALPLFESLVGHPQLVDDFAVRLPSDDRWRPLVASAVDAGWPMLQATLSQLSGEAAHASGHPTWDWDLGWLLDWASVGADLATARRLDAHLMYATHRFGEGAPHDTVLTWISHGLSAVEVADWLDAVRTRSVLRPEHVVEARRCGHTPAHAAALRLTALDVIRVPQVARRALDAGWTPGAIRALSTTATYADPFYTQLRSWWTTCGTPQVASLCLEAGIGLDEAADLAQADALDVARLEFLAGLADPVPAVKTDLDPDKLGEFPWRAWLTGP